MKTDDLVAMLSTGDVAVPRRSASGRIGLALLAGLPVSLFILFAEYGMRRDIVQAMFWPSSMVIRPPGNRLCQRDCRLEILPSK